MMQNYRQDVREWNALSRAQRAERCNITDLSDPRLNNVVE